MQAQLFRKAWAETTGNLAVDALVRRSLSARARRVPELLAVAQELELAEKSERESLDTSASTPREAIDA